MALTAAERERIASNQREANMRAIRLHAIESPMRVPVSRALVASIQYAERNETSIQRALISINDVRLILITLADAGAMSQIAAATGIDALDNIRRTLVRFAPPPEPRSVVHTKREGLAA